MEPVGQLEVVLRDGFDREQFDRRWAEDPQIERLSEELARVLPRPRALLSDLFCALYKLTLSLRPAGELAASVQLHRRLLTAITGAPAFATLAASCRLDAAASAAALSRLVAWVLEALSRGDRVVASELSELAEAAADEDALAALEEQLAHLADLPAEAQAALSGPAQAEQARLSRRVAAAQEALNRVAEGLPLGLDLDLAARVAALAEALPELPEQLRQLGLQGEGAAARQELGDQLLKSKKLRQIAKLCGAMEALARQARRAKLSRAPQAVHAVEVGRDLTRLLPSELLGLISSGAQPRAAALMSPEGAARLEFLRRYAEGQLLSYALNAPAERGPIVICVDGSGSMQGLRELWSKAVALSLAQIARREGRRCFGLVFSDPGALLEVDLSRPRRARRSSGVEPTLALAEYFPGGGTAFEPPLSRALALASEGAARGADIVFITDGEAAVSERLLSALAAARRRLGLKIFGVLVDAEGRVDEASLARLSDRLWRVSELAPESLSGLFSAV